MTEVRDHAERDSRRWWLPRSLGARLLIGAGLLVLLASLASILVGATVLGRFARGQIDAGLDARIVAIASGLTVTADGLPEVADSVANAPFDRPGPGWYWQISSDGGVVRSATLHGATLVVTRDPPRKGRTAPDLPWSADLDGPEREQLIARISDRVIDGRTVRVIATVPKAALTGPLREMLSVLVLSMAGLGMVLLGMVVLGVRAGLRPLRELRGEVARVRTGRAARLGTDSQPAEVLPLVAEINTLLDENEEGIARARRNVANLAHGLKTPLTTLAITLTEPGRDPDGVLAPLVGTMDRQIRHHLARARAAAVDGTTRAHTDLATCFRDLALVMEKVHADRGVVLSCSGPTPLFVACEAQDLDELFGNLLDNAFAHAATRVRVSWHSATRMAEVEIEDDGRGMTPAEIASVWSPGRRLDESRLGYGFGLSISAEIAELYGGSIALSPGATGGLRARVVLPKAEFPGVEKSSPPRSRAVR